MVAAATAAAAIRRIRVRIENYFAQ
jgi:hypothetical protein